MRFKVTLPDADVEFLDEYVERRGLASRSEALRRAVRLLRTQGLNAEYAAAWAEWVSGEELLWDTTSSDGSHHF